MKSKQTRGVDVAVPCHSRYIPLLKQVVVDMAAEGGLTRDEASDLVVAILEAVANAIKHSRAKTMRLSILLKEDSVVAKVLDDGIGFAFTRSQCKFPQETDRSGRGIPLMKTLSDRFSVKTGEGFGTLVTLTKRCAN
ncbi:MAG: ATP-binding protein [Candidatus Aquicultorales bacterium]